jgi:hypothetical protein
MLVSDTEATMIREAFDRNGEAGAVAEVQRIFRGLESAAEARKVARMIAAWRPLAGIVEQRKSRSRRGA